MHDYSYTATGMDEVYVKALERAKTLKDELDRDSRALVERLGQAFSTTANDKSSLSNRLLFLKGSHAHSVNYVAYLTEEMVKELTRIENMECIMQTPEFAIALEDEKRDETLTKTKEQLIEDAKKGITDEIISKISASPVGERECEIKPPCFKPGDLATIVQGYSDEPPTDEPFLGRRTPNQVWYSIAHVFKCIMKPGTGRMCVVLYKNEVQGEPLCAVVPEDYLKGPPKKDCYGRPRCW